MANLAADLDRSIDEIASQWRSERAERQARRHLDRRDFDLLRDAGLLKLAVPESAGGSWQNAASSARRVCEIYRRLASADPSVALVSTMHPTVLGFWLSTSDPSQPDWEEQRQAVFASAAAGEQWGTITSEPGSGGDIARTRAIATPTDAQPFLAGRSYAVTGDKHFGSGFGITDRMITTAIPEGESDPTVFVLDVRDRPWDGSAGFRLTAEWDGMGMAATQSHAMRLEGAPAVRLAWNGGLDQITRAAGPFVATMFTSVILGVLDEAIGAAREQVRPKSDELRAYERVEWSRAGARPLAGGAGVRGRPAGDRGRGPGDRVPRRLRAPSKPLRISPRPYCGASPASWAEGPTHDGHRSPTGSRTSARSGSSDHRGGSPTTACSRHRSTSHSRGRLTRPLPSCRPA